MSIEKAIDRFDVPQSFRELVMTEAPRLAHLDQKDVRNFIYEKTIYWIPRLWHIENTVTKEQAALFADKVATQYPHLRINEIDFMLITFTEYKDYGRIDLSVLNNFLGVYIRERSEKLSEIGKEMSMKKKKQEVKDDDKDLLTAEQFYSLIALQFIMKYWKI